MPQNLAYLFAAFAVTWAVFCVYVWLLQNRLRETRQRLSALEEDTRAD